MPQLATPGVVEFHARVADLCTARLREALGSNSALFDRQLRDRRWEDTHETEDLTSTAICLIGLHRAAIDPGSIGLDPERTLSALLDVTRRRDYAGGLGLVLWANAVWNGPSLSEALEKSGQSLGNTKGLSALTTMEVAWLVSGLVHEVKRAPSPTSEAALATAAEELFSRYRPEAQLFCHASDSAPPVDRLRKSVPNFADQIYSVQATAFLALARGNTRALAMSDACAKRLVELQGTLGQWWWHYDARDGSVAQGFPVYSVHQHAMAPMALMTLEQAGGGDYRRAIEVSHAWVANNELGVSLLDEAGGTIWRDIELEEGRVERLIRHARSVSGLHPGDGGTHAKNLKINYETRPYEWAWCLFAGAIAAGTDGPGHLV